MRFIPALFATACTGLAMPASAHVLTFEDLSCGACSYDVVPATYAGFQFSGWNFGVDTAYTPASGVTDLFTDFADPSDPGLYIETDGNAIGSTTPFVFDGAWFSGYSGARFKLYLAGSLVYTSIRLDDAAGPDPYLPALLSSGYAGLVDTVVVSAVQGYYSMDDFTYHDVTSAVPEPDTYALLLIGLGAAGIIRKRREI